MTIDLTVQQAQHILMAFYTLEHVPLLFAEYPSLVLTEAQREDMLARIRQAKKTVFDRYPRISKAAHQDAMKQSIQLEMTVQEMDDVIAVLGTIVREAEPNPGHIRALVADIPTILSTIARVRSQYPKSPRSSETGGNANY